MKHAFFGRALPALTLAAVAFASLPAIAGPYSSMVVFGDSLSDAGNDAPSFSSDRHQSRAGHYRQQLHSKPTVRVWCSFSNGPVWASDVATTLGVSPLPSLAGGTNFAFGGARVATDGSGLPPSLALQQTFFLGSTIGCGLTQCALCYRGRRQRRARCACSSRGEPEPGCRNSCRKRCLRIQYGRAYRPAPSSQSPAHCCLGCPRSW